MGKKSLQKRKKLKERGRGKGKKKEKQANQNDSKGIILLAKYFQLSEKYLSTSHFAKLMSVDMATPIQAQLVFQDQAFSNNFRCHPKVILLTYSNPSTTERSFMKNNSLKINGISLIVVRSTKKIFSRFIQY